MSFFRTSYYVAEEDCSCFSGVRQSVLCCDNCCHLRRWGCASTTSASKRPQVAVFRRKLDISGSADASAPAGRPAGARNRLDNSIISSEPRLPMAMSVARRAGASDVPDDEAYTVPSGAALSQALPAGTSGDQSTLLRPAQPTSSGRLGAGADRPDLPFFGSPKAYSKALTPARPGPTASAGPAAAPPAVPPSPAVPRRFTSAQRRASSAERHRGTAAAQTVESASYSGPTVAATTTGAPRVSKRKLGAAAAAAAPDTSTPPGPQPTEQFRPHSGPSFKAEKRAVKRPGMSTLARNAAKFVAQTERDSGASDGDIAGGADITRAPSIEADRGRLAVADGGFSASRSAAPAIPTAAPHDAAAAAPVAPPPSDGTPAWAGPSRSSPVPAPPAASLLAAPVDKAPMQPAISAATLEIMSRLIPSADGPHADQVAATPQLHPHRGCVLKPAAIGALHLNTGTKD